MLENMPLPPMPERGADLLARRDGRLWRAGGRAGRAYLSNLCALADAKARLVVDVVACVTGESPLSAEFKRAVLPTAPSPPCPLASPLPPTRNGLVLRRRDGTRHRNIPLRSEN